MTHIPRSLDHEQATGARRSCRLFLWLLAFACLTAGLGKIVLTGVPAALKITGSTDFRTVYASTRAFLHGQSPYDQAALVDVMRDAGLSGVDQMLHWKDALPVYPPTAFVLISPVAWLPWPAAEVVWLVIDLLAIATLAWCAVLMSEVPKWSWRSVLLIGLVLMLIPMAMSVQYAQPTLVAAGLLTAAMAAAQKKHDMLAILFTVLSVGIKPQIGGLFIAYCFLDGRWKIMLLSILGVLLLIGIAVVRLSLAVPGWFSQWQSVIAASVAPGAINDFSPMNPVRFTILNPQVPLEEFVSKGTANMVVYAVTGALLILWLIAFPRWRKSPAGMPLTVGTLCLISMLPIYHRLYDSVILALPLSWAVFAVGRKEYRGAWWVFVVGAMFLIPTQSVVNKVNQHLSALASNRLWNAFILARLSWVALILAVVLVGIMLLERKPDNASLRPDSDELT